MNWKLKAQVLLDNHKEQLLTNKLISNIDLDKEDYLHSNDWSLSYSECIRGYSGDDPEKFDELIEFLSIVTPNLSFKEYIPIHQMIEVVEDSNDYLHISFQWRISLEELINYLDSISRI